MPAWGDVLLPGEIELLWYYVKTRAGKEPASFEQDAKEVFVVRIFGTIRYLNAASI